jgi:uncharacterized alpha-E superfamily protein
MPRSLTFCYRFLAEHLKFLGDDYGQQHPCHRTVERTQTMLTAGSIKDIFDAGLHEFLANFIQENTKLGDQIAQDYRFN